MTRTLLFIRAFAVAAALALATSPAMTQAERTKFAVPIHLSDFGTEQFFLIMARSRSIGFEQCPEQIGRASAEFSRPQIVLGSLDDQVGGQCVPLPEGGCYCAGRPGILAPILISQDTMDMLRTTLSSAIDSNDELDLQFSAEDEMLEVLRLESQ